MHTRSSRVLGVFLFPLLLGPVPVSAGGPGAPVDGIPVGGGVGVQAPDIDLASQGGVLSALNGGRGGSGSGREESGGKGPPWLTGGSGDDDEDASIGGVDLNDKGDQLPSPHENVACKQKKKGCLLRTWPGLKQVLLKFQAGDYAGGVAALETTCRQLDDAERAGLGKPGKQAAATRRAFALAQETGGTANADPASQTPVKEAVNTAAEQSSPILLDMNGNGIADVTSTHVTDPTGGFVREGSVAFDVSGLGRGWFTEWVKPGTDGLLAHDADGNGRVDSIVELFGDADGFEDGYAKLAMFDRDGDGAVSGGELAGLSVWIDDGDGLCQPTELRGVAEHGITRLSVRHVGYLSSFVRNGVEARSWDWFPRSRSVAD